MLRLGERTATPMLDVTKISRRSALIGAARLVLIRSARIRAAPSASASSTTITNSSPPRRAARSLGPTMRFNRCATTLMTSSPVSWPMLSLIDLK